MERTFNIDLFKKLHIAKKISIQLIKKGNREQDRSNQSKCQGDKQENSFNFKDIQKLRRVQSAKQKNEDNQKYEKNQMIKVNQVNIDIKKAQNFTQYKDKQLHQSKKINLNPQQQKCQQYSVIINNVSFDIYNKYYKNQKNINEFQLNKSNSQSKFIVKNNDKDIEDGNKTYRSNISNTSTKVSTTQIESETSIQMKPKVAPPRVTAKSWALYDADTGIYLQGKQPFQGRQIASLTKIMTFYTTLKIVENYKLDINQIFFYVTKSAESISGTSAGLKRDSWINLKDLYYALMLPSGNDAAIVIAENLGSLLATSHLLKDFIIQKEKILYVLKNTENSMDIFIHEMNKNARIQQSNHSFYANCHGLNNKQSKNCAHDIGRLCFDALQYPIFREVVSSPSHKCNIHSREGILELFWQNTNLMLLKQGWYGIKTGVTSAAGHCLASSSKSNSRSLILVLLGSDSLELRWKETEKLMEWAFNNQNE